MPEITEAKQEPQAPEAGGSMQRKLIDRGPQVEISHSSAREAIQEIIHWSGGGFGSPPSPPRGSVALGFLDGVLNPVGFGDGRTSLTLEGQAGEVYPPTETAIDRHVERRLVVLRTAGGYEMELQVIGE